MRRAPGAALQRRRIGRLLRSIDVYIVFAVLGVLAYIIVVNLTAETLALSIEEGIATELQKVAANGSAKDAPPAALFWPHRWPEQPLAELMILRDGTNFVESSLARLVPLLAQQPAAQAGLWDLLLLTKAKTALTPSVAELRRVVQTVTGQTPKPSAAVTAAVREAVESAAAVWAVKGLEAEVAQTEDIRRELLGFPSPPVLSINSKATSWEAFSSAVWELATRTDLKTKNNLHEVFYDVLNMCSKYWMPTTTTAANATALLRPLVDHRLRPLLSGSYDSVVPLPRLLLHLWVLGGRRDVPMVSAYDAAVGSILQQLLHTRTVHDGPHAMNFTFVASAGDFVVPVATPRTCALAGVLAQGVRYGAHRYTGRASTAQFSEDDVLQAAEALAASCFQQYADPAGHGLRTAAYVTSSGPVAAYVATAHEEKKGDASASQRMRRTACDVPVLLLESFHELYLVTEDAMYGLWSLLVMSEGVSDHCAVAAHTLNVSNGVDGWLRYVRELRGLWLTFQHMDCIVFRRSRGTRGLCDLTATTLVSAATGHLVRLPAGEKATSSQ